MTRLARLHLASRRVPAALAVIVACAVVLWTALHRQWNAYGALQLPLLFETGCAVVIAVTTASPFGETERATGRWLPFLRLGATLALTAAAVGVLAAAGIGGHLAGGTVACSATLVGPDRHRPAVRRRARRRAGLGRPDGVHDGRRVRRVHPVARPGHDHAVDLAGPAPT